MKANCLNCKFYCSEKTVPNGLEQMGSIGQFTVSKPKTKRVQEGCMKGNEYFKTLKKGNINDVPTCFEPNDTLSALKTAIELSKEVLTSLKDK